MIGHIFLLIVIGWVIVYLYRLKYDIRLSPDGYFYLKQHPSGARYRSSLLLPVPYSLRPMLPDLLTTDKQWINATWISVAGVAGLSYAWFCKCLTPEQAFTGTLLLLTFTNITRLAAVFPVLIDAASIAATFMSSLLWINASAPVEYLIATCVSLLLALLNEKIAVFAALWSWSLYPLVGLAVTLVRYLIVRGDDEGIDWLKNPVREAIKTHGARFNNGTWWQAWGVLPLAFITMSFEAWLTVLISVLQLFHAQDYARVFLWCAPVVIIPLVQMFPNELLLPLVVANYLITSKDGTV